MDWAAFWATFSQTHLVTLSSTNSSSKRFFFKYTDFEQSQTSSNF
jgi:hypothetical protein